MKIGDLGMSRHVSDPSPGGSESHSSTLRSSYSSGARSSSSTPQHTTSRFGTPPGGSAPPARQLTADVVGTMAYAAPELLDETLQLPNSPAERLLKVGRPWSPAWAQTHTHASSELMPVVAVAVCV